MVQAKEIASGLLIALCIGCTTPPEDVAKEHLPPAPVESAPIDTVASNAPTTSFDTVAAAPEKFVPPAAPSPKRVTTPRTEEIREEPPPPVEELKEFDMTTIEEGEDFSVPPPAEDPSFEEPVLFAEEMPQFPGGELGLAKYLRENVNYPASEKEAGMMGKVYISFTIGRDGSISDVQQRRGVSPGLDREAIRVVKSMPKWTPGKQRVKPVPVKMTLPIAFVP